MPENVFIQNKNNDMRIRAWTGGEVRMKQKDVSEHEFPVELLQNGYIFFNFLTYFFSLTWFQIKNHSFDNFSKVL